MACFFCQSVQSDFHVDAMKHDFRNKQVVILPLGKNISKVFIHETQKKIREFIPNLIIQEGIPMPPSAYYPARKRYRADTLIRWLDRMADKDQIILGITHHDISTTKKPIPDWGVMGLGFQPGKACVASDFRLKRKKSFWKVAIHELGHTAGLKHCPVKTCLMRDAEGRDQTGEEKDFCSSCRERLKKAGWTLK